MTEAIQRNSVIAIIALNLAVLFALLSSLISIMTILPEARTSAYLVGCGFGALAVGLAGFAWRSVPRPMWLLPGGAAALGAFGAVTCASCLVL